MSDEQELKFYSSNEVFKEFRTPELTRVGTRGCIAMRQIRQKDEACERFETVQHLYFKEGENSHDVLKVIVPDAQMLFRIEPNQLLIHLFIIDGDDRYLDRGGFAIVTHIDTTQSQKYGEHLVGRIQSVDRKELIKQKII